jgi:hypothetical protein
MTENQENQFQRLGLNFKSLWGRPLKAIDCQNLFCETDKYCRAAFPDLKSNRKKIKAKFTATPQPIDYFYPPKWCINDQVQETLDQRLPPLEIPNLQDNGQQLSLELDSLVKTTSKISDTLSKLHKQYKQETQNKKSNLLQNTELEKYQQLCLF